MLANGETPAGWAAGAGVAVKAENGEEPVPKVVPAVPPEAPREAKGEAGDVAPGAGAPKGEGVATAEEGAAVEKGAPLCSGLEAGAPGMENNEPPPPGAEGEALPNGEPPAEAAAGVEALLSGDLGVKRLVRAPCCGVPGPAPAKDGGAGGMPGDPAGDMPKGEAPPGAADSTFPKENGLPAGGAPAAGAGIANGEGAVLAGAGVCIANGEAGAAAGPGAALPLEPLNPGATAANGLIGKAVEEAAAGGSAAGRAIWKGEGACAGLPATEGAGATMPKGDAGVAKAAELPPGGAMPFPCPSRAFAIRLGSLAAGSGTVRGSCGETGV